MSELLFSKLCFNVPLDGLPFSLQIGYLDVVIPPDFIPEETSSDVIVPEGSSVKLTCRFVWLHIKREQRVLKLATSFDGGTFNHFNSHEVFPFGMMKAKSLGDVD